MFRWIVFLLFSILFLGCSSTRNSGNEAFALFQSEITDDWNEAIKTLRDDPRAIYIKNLIDLYLSRRYDPVKEELGALIQDYYKEFDIQLSILLGSIESVDEVQSAIAIVEGLERESKIEFATMVYKGEPSDIRTFEIEIIGSSLIDESYLDTLYDSEDKAVRLGVISSAAYIPGGEVREWLLDKIFSPDEEVSSSALFSLSKHGSPGFLLIADNLIEFTTRTQMVAIDILTFNKVVRAYPYFADLLDDPDSLITKRVLTAYRGFGKKNDIYIFEALRKAHPSLTLEILEIINSKSDYDYLEGVSYLLEREEVRQTIVDYAYDRRAWSFLGKELRKNNYMTPLIIETGIDRVSDFLFIDSYINYKAVDYLIHSVQFSRVLDYFIALEIDEKYISDYKVVTDIDRALSEISDFESLEGIDPVVTSYFVLEEEKERAKAVSDSFFKGMEDWISTGDDSILENNKKRSDISAGRVKEGRDNFLNSLSKDKLDMVLSYEENKLLVLSSYRRLTYRLKDYCEILINDRGYGFLIK